MSNKAKEAADELSHLEIVSVIGQCVVRLNDLEAQIKNYEQKWWMIESTLRGLRAELELKQTHINAQTADVTMPDPWRLQYERLTGRIDELIAQLKEGDPQNGHTSK